MISAEFALQHDLFEADSTPKVPKVAQAPPSDTAGKQKVTETTQWSQLQHEVDSLTDKMVNAEKRREQLERERAMRDAKVHITEVKKAEMEMEQMKWEHMKREVEM